MSVLDGQTRPSFVRSAADRFPSVRFRIVLLDSDPGVRRVRVGKRGQPKLATAQMDMWSAYLRGQADALKLPVVDTTVLTVQEVANALEAQVDAFRQEIGIVPGT